MSDAQQLTYKDSGVDRAAADDAKARISALVRSTYTDGVVGEFGAFGGCFRLGEGADATILVASADGVGTKLKVAVMAGIHDTVGYDLVSHCADDILSSGALPLFFLDYLALGEMKPGVVEQVEQVELVDWEYCGGTLTSGVVVTVGTVGTVGLVVQEGMELQERVYKYMSTLEEPWLHRWESM